MARLIRAIKCRAIIGEPMHLVERKATKDELVEALEQVGLGAMELE